MTRGHDVPVDALRDGGAGAPDRVAREVAEILAGARCSTWFVQTQHHTPVRLPPRRLPDSPRAKAPGAGARRRT
ncbi:hypothetical protein [Streptomyces sp. NPDC018321]|uniref:hypothetical protein n=1 Tax=unclassified Streptomyces TaxID=2593676 RepID=UPI0037A15B62